MAEPKINTSADVFNVLCREIELASNGEGDAARANSICRLTETAIKLARLQLEANRDDKADGIRFLDYRPSDPEVDGAVARLGLLQQELAVITKALDDPTTPESKVAGLEAKRANLSQEILLLERIKKKRQ